MSKVKPHQFGASLVEMSLLIALIALIGFASVQKLGKNVDCNFVRARTGIDTTRGMTMLEAFNCCAGPAVCTAGGCSCM